MGILFTCEKCGYERSEDERFDSCPCGHNVSNVSYFGEYKEYEVEVTVEKKYQVTVKARHESEARHKAEYMVDLDDDLVSSTTEIQYAEIINN